MNAVSSEIVLEFRRILHDHSAAMSTLGLALAGRTGGAIEMKFGPSPDGQFYGLASEYRGVPDGHGDIIEPGAYTETLRTKGAARPLLWCHDQAEPIGLVTLTDTPKGLFAHGQIASAARRGAEALQLMQMGALTGLSIGFVAVKSSGRAPRRLQQIDLHEISLVACPSQHSARISTRSAETSQALLQLKHSLADYRGMLSSTSQRR